MGTGVHKVFREYKEPFTMVPNDAVRNPDITPNAFRLLAYLMSHQDGYALTYQQIERQTTLKRYAINAAIGLLTNLGYLEVRRTKKANGQWGAKDWFLKDPATADESTVEPSHVEPFHSGTTSGHKKNTSKEKHSIEKNTNKEFMFKEFWNLYPKKQGRGAAQKALEKALNREKWEIILDGVQRFANDPNLPEKQFIPLASTWLNQDRWTDEPYAAPTVKLANWQKAALLAEKYRQEAGVKEIEYENKTVARELEAEVSTWLKGVDDE